ncbi:MAG: ribonuclease P protein component [Candidatus Omnitrophota bacterium]
MKIKHLLKAKDFADIMKTGSSVCGKTLCLYRVEEPGADSFAVGITVPKRYVPKAVTRNYIKRLIYAYFRGKEKNYHKNIKIVIRVPSRIKKDSRKVFSRRIIEELDFLTNKDSGK